MELGFTDQIVKEMKTHPYTMLVLIGLMIATPYMWFNTARADDVMRIAQQLNNLDSSIKLANLEQKLRSINTDLFNLKQKLQDRRDARKPLDAVDQEYRDRIVSLENDKDDTERALRILGKSINP